MLESYRARHTIGRGRRICFPNTVQFEDLQIGVPNSQSVNQLLFEDGFGNTESQNQNKQPVDDSIKPVGYNFKCIEDISHLLQKVNVEGNNGIKDFYVIAALEIFPEDQASSDVDDGPGSYKPLTDEQLEEQEETLQELKSLRLVQSVLRRCKRNLPYRGPSSIWVHEEEEEEIDDENEGEEEEINVSVVWNQPYTSPISVLKKNTNIVARDFHWDEKLKKSVKFSPPLTHKSGFHPVRKPKGTIQYKTKSKRQSASEIKKRSEAYLIKEILSDKYITGELKQPLNPLNYILNSPNAFVEFFVVQSTGPTDFYVQLGYMDLRRRFNYMESEMKVWYTKKRKIMEQFMFDIDQIQYKHYYIYFNDDIEEYVRCQVSKPVVANLLMNPHLTVEVALIDYGGHQNVNVKRILPMMPYFAKLPSMAIRGTLSLTKNLEENTGRTEYTDVEKAVFLNVLEFHKGLVEALVAKEDSQEFCGVDREIFPAIEMTLFVMENGKRKSIDEMLISGEKVHALYL